MNKKSWLEIECVLPVEFEDILSGIFAGLGADGTWSEPAEVARIVRVRGYFEEGRGGDVPAVSLEKALARVPGLSGKYQVLCRRQEEADWLAEWKKHHKPERVGRTLHILPEWWEETPKEGTVIRIDPGMAFGTGGHATTRLCLGALEEEILKSKAPRKLSVLDLGCGSGILAIAALKLGAGEAVGVDNDPAALENAERNARLNGVEVLFLTEIPKEKRFDIVVSNILAETHLELKEAMRSVTKEGGRLILSGILGSKAEMVSSAMAAMGFVQERDIREGEWACLYFRK